MTPEGLVDPSFISMNSNPAFQSQTGGDYHVFPDGRVLLSGSHTLSDTARGFVGQYRLVWFSNEGYLDTTRTHRQANGPIGEFKELPDGKFICTCSCTQYEGQPVSRLFRIHADGSLDTTFNAGVNWGNILAYHPLPDGRVYVGGRYKRAAAPDDTLYLARFMPDGSLDPTFLPTALSPGTLPNPSLGAAVVAITPWHNGTLLVGGRFRHVNGADRNSICLLEEDGTVNGAFDGQGVGVFTFASTAYTTVAQILPDTAGQWVYICGAYAGYDDGTINDPQQRFVSRLLVSELTVGAEERAMPGIRVYPNPASTTATLELDVLSPHAQLVLRDALGREVLRQRVHAHTNVLNLQALPDGIYTLELREEHKRISVQRLAVRH